MAKERKMALTVKKYSFKEAEEADDKYWANASTEERLRELVELRKIFFGNVPAKMQKIVSRRNIYEQEEN